MKAILFHLKNQVVIILLTWIFSDRTALSFSARSQTKSFSWELFFHNSHRWAKERCSWLAMPKLKYNTKKHIFFIIKYYLETQKVHHVCYTNDNNSSEQLFFDRVQQWVFFILDENRYKRIVTKCYHKYNKYAIVKWQ